MKSILNLPRVSGVYFIKNIQTGQLYIGSSQNIKKRCNAHRCALNNGKHSNQKLQRSYTKYGASAFDFKVLEQIDGDEVIDAERRWVKEMRPYFNIREVVESNKGVKLSKETRKRMSEAQKGKPMSEAKRINLEKLHKNRIGKPVTGRAKESLKLGPASLIGKPQSDSTRLKVSQSKIGRKFNKETRKFERQL